MRTHTTRTTTRLTLTLALTTALFAAGCGSEKAGDTGTTKPRARDTSSPSAGRAQQVADAWDGSEAAKAWLEGYFPMGEAVQPPGAGFRNEDDKTAYKMESYVLRGKLPTTAPKEGQAKWESGGSLNRPLVDARQTYTTLDRFGNTDGPHLTVTGAKLGGMTIATSRGPATVPAWLFTLEGYDEPLKRVALRPSKLPKSPIRGLGESPTELTPIPRLVEVSGDGRTVTVLANHGACDDGPRVKALEMDGSVVLSATVDYGKHDPGLPCPAILFHKKVRVGLDRPLGDRILLDAYRGRPVPYREGNWASPSWS